MDAFEGVPSTIRTVVRTDANGKLLVFDRYSGMVGLDIFHHFPTNIKTLQLNPAEIIERNITSAVSTSQNFIEYSFLDIIDPEDSQNPTASLKYNLDHAYSWLGKPSVKKGRSSQDPRQTHGSTWMDKNPVLPTRILDLSPPNSKLSVRLYESKSEQQPYVCLSHCWGKSNHLLTTTKNIKDRKRDIPFADFPPLYRDAIIVTRKLGYRYLWIDSLCIIQDDEDDWSREAARMSAVYQGAGLTIAALHCKDSSERLFQGTVPYQLLTRAWVFQEVILSDNLLHFDGSSVWLESENSLMYRGYNYTGQDLLDLYSQSVHERFPLPISLESSPSRVNTDNAGGWNRLVEQFTLLDMTFIKDRLPAMQGLSAEYSAKYGPFLGRYVAGIWEKEAASGLAWRLGRDPPDQRRPDSTLTKSPTWSWASVSGPCIFERNLKLVEGIEVISVTMPQDSEYDETVHRFGCIILKGRVATGKLVLLEDDETLVLMEEGDHFRCLSIYNDCLWGKSEVGNGMVYVFVLGYCDYQEVALVLRCVDKGRGVYERIGMAYENHKPGERDLRTNVPVAPEPIKLV